MKTDKIKIEKTKIVGGDFFEDFGKKIAKNPKELKNFIKDVNTAYKKTDDIEILFTALKILSYAKGNIKQQSKQAKITRATTYNIFKKGANPTFKNIANYANVLGLHIQLSL